MKFLIFLISLLGLCWFVWSIFKACKKARLLKKARQHLNDAPAFAPDLTDCYVKFHGRVITPNQNTTPLQHQACVLYQTKVFAEWQTKLKKPQKGMTTNRKTLYSDQSTLSLPVELVGADGTRVYVDFTAFDQTGNVVELSNDKFKSARCPDLCSDQAQAKYQFYTSVEKWLESNAAVMIYGKLEKSSAGQLSLAPTGKADYPTVFKVNLRGGGRNLVAELNKKLFRTRVGIFFRIALLFGLGYAVTSGIIH
jgi:hypothetical protein